MAPFSAMRIERFGPRRILTDALLLVAGGGLPDPQTDRPGHRLSGPQSTSNTLYRGPSG